jgi:hypothetical protein
MTGLVVHIIMLAELISAPFIYFNLIPRQKGLHILGTEPLSPLQVLAVLMFLYLKYQLILLLITLPVFTALAISSNFWFLFYSLATQSIFLVGAMPVIHLIAEKRWTYFQKITVYLILTVFYFSTYFTLYWTTDYALYFDLAVIFVTAWLLGRCWRSSWASWDYILLRARLHLEQTTRQVSGLTYFTFPHVIPAKWRPLLIKEILSYLRNKKYQRLKIISLVVFLLILSLISINFADNYLAAVSLVTFLFIWEHYSHQFNEKYVSRDPVMFYKTLPVKFRHFLLSKFFSEFIFIIGIVLILFLSTVLHGIIISQILLLCLMVILVSAFILYIIILIRLVFYDRPRFAGYAYHMLIVFMLVMNLTYYLVGPMISLFIMVYLNYKSYRQFAG